ncbi:O-methylsterigmatocystin oxidoreductase [Mycena venus]|uniref:O-methylsterigmatocystin oxidoreductase n=1 Tax=Mycena venus TaxID=2733690 RepID=A0A8H6YKS5_9AGAR|nr:O-methylsterigmatocystin oxidoreductase [Mycena venus]
MNLGFPLRYAPATIPMSRTTTIFADAEPSFSFNLFTTVGALEIGVLVALFHSGLLAAQVLIYFQRHKSDPWGLRCLVGVCGTLDFGHTIAICHTLYTVTIVQYGKPALLLVPPLSLDTTILMSAFIGPLEQGWFTYRLYRLTKKYTLPLFCLSLTIARFVGLVGLSSIALRAYPLPEYYQRASWIIEAVVIVSAVLDTTLVAALCYYLSSWRLDKSRVMYKIVNQIMTWTIETGALTIVGALGLLITFLTMKDNFIYIGFFLVQPKFFSNSLLLSINARDRFSETIRSSVPHSRPPASSMIGQLEMATFPPSPTTPEAVEFTRFRVEGSEFGHDGKMPMAI